MAEEKIIYKKISQLDETPEIYGPESVPVNQNGKTFRVTFDTVVNWLFRLIGIVSTVNTINDLKKLPVRFRKSVHVLEDGVGGFFKYRTDGTPDDVDIFRADDGGVWVRFNGNLYSRKEMDDKFADVNLGVTDSITTSQTLAQLNALADGIYEAETSGVYANGFTVEEGFYTKFKKAGTTWRLLSKTKMPTQPADGKVAIGNESAVNGDRAWRGINNSGAPELTKGKIVKSVNDYPITGKAIVNGNAGVVDNGNTSITDLVELPEDWSSVIYYHGPFTSYGLGFYDRNGNALSTTLPNTLDSIIQLNKTNYPELVQAKYVRNTIYTDNPAYNHKSMLLIVSNNDLSAIVPKVNKIINYDAWKAREKNAGNIIVEYDYNALPSTPSAGLKRSTHIDLTDWNSLVALIPKSASQKIAFFNESYVEIGNIPGNIDSRTQYRTVEKSEFPGAKYIQITGLDAERDNFKLSVSYSAKKKNVDANKEIDALLKQQGLEVEYLTYEPTKFNKVGVYYFSTGTINPALTQYKAVDLTELPSDWSYIEYDNFLSSSYGLVFFDEFGRFVGSNPNSSVSEFRVIRALRENFSTAKYYAYAWGDAFKDLYFKIVRDPKKYPGKPEPKSLTFLNTRLANLDITSFEEWNESQSATPIIKGNVFSSSEIPGRGFIRIPTMAISNAGTDLVLVEARNSGEDKGQFDIYLKRRAIGGAWVSTNLFPYNPTTYGRGMNPSIVIDKAGAHGVTGRIYAFCGTIKKDTEYAVFSPTSELDFLYRYSDDDGVTWSSIASLKSLWNTANYTGVLPSCAAGIQMTDGTLVVPTMIVRSQTWRSGVLYMKPSGSWTFSTFTHRNLDNECNVIELGNKLILSCRTESQQFKFRPVYEYDFTNNKFIQADSDSTFDPYINCKASIIKVVRGGTTFYLKCYPDSSKVAAQQTGNTRFNLTVWVSLDLKKWIRSYVVQRPLSMGYSELAYHDGSLKIVYETLNPGLEVDIQDLSPLLDKFKYDAEVNSKLTAEERLNRLIYFLKSWSY